MARALAFQDPTQCVHESSTSHLHLQHDARNSTQLNVQHALRISNFLHWIDRIGLRKAERIALTCAARMECESKTSPRTTPRKMAAGDATPGSSFTGARE